MFPPVARGLDLPAVNWIVQYDPPAESTEYIHRVSTTSPSSQMALAQRHLVMR
jgi:hypothetical protein